jgi:hypothetical protein
VRNHTIELLAVIGKVPVWAKPFWVPKNLRELYLFQAQGATLVWRN